MGTLILHMLSNQNKKEKKEKIFSKFWNQERKREKKQKETFL